jgi:Ni/Co efflux regulator RcnB
MAGLIDKEHTMLKRSILSTLVALSVGAGPAFAQGNPRPEDFPQWQPGTEHQRAQTGQPSQPARSYQGAQRDPYRGDPHSYQGDASRGHDGMDGDRGDGRPRGAGPDHAWHRGDRLPSQYRSHQYVVDDWRGHRLSAPPHGYHWVQAGGDYVLAAIATGVIASILLDH